MDRDIDFEKNIIKNIINDFTTKKQHYQDIFSNNEEELLSKVDEIFKNLSIPNNSYYYHLSTYFLTFVEKAVNVVDNILPENICNIVKNIINKIFIDILDLNKHESYIKELLNNICNHSLNFCKFLDNYKEIDIKTKQIFIKEFLLASFLPFMIIPIGYIKNYDLWFYIQSIWIIFDNIMDIPDLKNKLCLIKETIFFFENKIYDKSYNEIYKYITISDEPCLKLLKKIFDLNIGNGDKINICKRFAKLYRYSYSIKGFNKEKESDGKKIIEISILKTRKSLSIFQCSLNVYLGKVKDQYYISLIIQLFDDFVDLQDDIKDNNITLFLKDSKIDRAINIIILLEYVNKHFPELNNFFLIAYIAYIDHNKEYLPKSFTNKVKEYAHINYEQCNVNRVLNLMMNINFVEKSFKIYLNNDMISNDYNKLSNEQIINEIKN